MSEMLRNMCIKTDLMVVLRVLEFSDCGKEIWAAWSSENVERD